MLVCFFEKDDFRIYERIIQPYIVLYKYTGKYFDRQKYMITDWFKVDDFESYSIDTAYVVYELTCR